MTDYLGNEIHIGDTIVYVGKTSRGYNASFEESVVEVMRDARNEVMVSDHWCTNAKGRKIYNVINLTALGVRPRVLKFDYEDIKDTTITNTEEEYLADERLLR